MNENNSSTQVIEWMNAEEASRYLKVSRGTIYNLVSSGVLKGYRLGRRIRFIRRELDEAILSGPKKGGGHEN